MKRQYGLVGDRTVVEEREVVLTERRFVWGNIEAVTEAVDIKDEAKRVMAE
jgi:hypothetical protein